MYVCTLQMFTGVYRVIKAFFCNICRENPVIFTDCREIPADVHIFVIVQITVSDLLKDSNPLGL